jgi:hypothetical protein
MFVATNLPAQKAPPQRPAYHGRAPPQRPAYHGRQGHHLRGNASQPRPGAPPVHDRQNAAPFPPAIAWALKHRHGPLHLAARLRLHRVPEDHACAFREALEVVEVTLRPKRGMRTGACVHELRQGVLCGVQQQCIATARCRVCPWSRPWSRPRSRAGGRLEGRRDVEHHAVEAGDLSREAGAQRPGAAHHN